MKEKEIVGRNLKALREANCYTQEQVASFLGIQRSAYANYESGEREAPIGLLEKAGELMGCELSVLFDEDEKVVRDMLVCASGRIIWVSVIWRRLPRSKGSS
mgnify:CR=1 FL=1